MLLLMPSMSRGWQKMVSCWGDLFAALWLMQWSERSLQRSDVEDPTLGASMAPLCVLHADPAIHWFVTTQ